jgi:5,6,7,8-tetrahydromethanopterin hydro-lyase
LQLGECFVGDGPNAAHVNTILGPREGPVGAAWATALATPTAGHAPFVVVLHPNLPVKPFTILVNKAPIAGDTHARMTWGPAQAGVASGVAEAVAQEIVFDIEDVLIAAVWVDPNADDEQQVFVNNRQATFGALAMGQQGSPTQTDIEERRAEVWNPFFTPREGPPEATPR